MAQDPAEVCPAPGSAEECPEPGPHGSKSTSEPEKLQRFGQTSAYNLVDSIAEILQAYVRHYLCRSWALLGIPLEQVCHQVDGFKTGIWDQCLQVTGNTLRPAEIHSTCQLVSLWPIVLQGEVHLTNHIYHNIGFNKKFIFNFL